MNSVKTNEQILELIGAGQQSFAAGGPETAARRFRQAADLLDTVAIRNQQEAGLIVTIPPNPYDTLRDCIKLFDIALPKFDWGNFAVTEYETEMMSEIPNKARASLLGDYRG